MPGPYDKGDVVRVIATFLASGGGAAVPGTTYLRVNAATGISTWTSASYTIMGSNSFRADLAITQTGVWGYRWEALGANAAAVEGTFSVLSTVF